MSSVEQADEAIAVVRGAAMVHADAAEVLEHQIISARRAGAPLRAIARAAGLSHQTIANICKGTK